jgi:hypothetical protein
MAISDRPAAVPPSLAAAQESFELGRDPRRYGVVVSDGNELDLAATTRLFLEASSGLEMDEGEAAVIINVVWEVALAMDPGGPRRGRKYEMWLCFELARTFLSLAAPDHRGESGIAFYLPFVCVFRDALERLGKLPDREFWRVDWHDWAAVQLAFEDAWMAVRYPKGEGLLKGAASYARGAAGGWPGIELRELRLLLHYASFLQRHRGKEPIFLSYGSAEAALELNKGAAGILIKKAVRLGYLEVVDASYSWKDRKGKSYRCREKPRVGLARG